MKISMNTIQIEKDRLVLTGELGLAQVSALWHGLQKHPALQSLAVVDCRALGRVDSSAVALLLNLQAICQNTLRLESASPTLVTLLGLYNVDTMLPLMGEST